MSKKSKTAARDKRRKEKRARKEANRARYAAMRDAGNNSKSKAGDQSARKTVRFVRHPNGSCGNVGCQRCSPTAQALAHKRDA